jgi:hypothetical protein
LTEDFVEAGKTSERLKEEMILDETLSKLVSSFKALAFDTVAL